MKRPKEGSTTRNKAKGRKPKKPPADTTTDREQRDEERKMKSTSHKDKSKQSQRPIFDLEAVVQDQVGETDGEKEKATIAPVEPPLRRNIVTQSDKMPTCTKEQERATQLTKAKLQKKSSGPRLRKTTHETADDEVAEETPIKRVDNKTVDARFY